MKLKQLWVAAALCALAGGAMTAASAQEVIKLGLSFFGWVGMMFCQTVSLLASSQPLYFMRLLLLVQ